MNKYVVVVIMSDHVTAPARPFVFHSIALCRFHHLEKGKDVNTCENHSTFKNIFSTSTYVYKRVKGISAGDVNTCLKDVS